MTKVSISLINILLINSLATDTLRVNFDNAIDINPISGNFKWQNILKLLQDDKFLKIIMQYYRIF